MAGRTGFIYIISPNIKYVDCNLKGELKIQGEKQKMLHKLRSRDSGPACYHAGSIYGAGCGLVDERRGDGDVYG